MIGKVWNKYVLAYFETVILQIYSVQVNLSEALILESINPQYDERLFIESPKNTSSEHVVV